MHVALLRAINVGGNNLISMSDLRQMFADLGYAGATTLLQSGNVVFDGGRKGAARLEQLFERETAERFGATIDYCVRSTEQWQSIVDANPFAAEAKSAPNHLVVMLLKSASAAGAIQALRAAIRGPERIHNEGRELYIVYPDGIGTSKLTNRVIETKLATRGTARNWNTVMKLAERMKDEG